VVDYKGMGALVVGVGGPTPATGAPSPASLVVDYKGMGLFLLASAADASNWSPHSIARDGL